MADPLDVLAVGNALVDVLVQTDDRELERLALTKGTMALVDEAQARRLYDGVGPAVEVSGGSAANTAAGVAALGRRAGFVGRVRDDQLGRVFGHDLRSAGVAFDTTPAQAGPETGRCLVMVSPDGERTMNTYLGASADLHADDLDPDAVRAARVVYLEGYLWDPPQAKDAYRAAIDLTNAAGGMVAFSLSDLFCVERHRAEFRQLVQGGVEIVFANDVELSALYETDDVESALKVLADEVKVAAVTRGAAGATVLWEGSRVDVAAAAVDKVVDTTGAGDLFASGFLVGYCTAPGGDAAAAATRCGRLGALAAAEIISHLGARPEADLAALAAAAGLL